MNIKVAAMRVAGSLSFIPNQDPSQEFPVMESDESESLENLKKAGFKEESGTIMHDGYGMVYIFANDGGTLCWFPLRYD